MSVRRLALIPAKGKSTRLPRKNVLNFAGKPMLAWAIQNARESALFDQVVVSTEDEEIAAVAQAYGANVPFMRDDTLAVDPFGVEAVALDALARLDALGHQYDVICILLPTCPLRSTDDVISAMALFEQQGASSLMSVTEYDHSPYSAYQDDSGVDASGLLVPVFPDKNKLKSQELPITYRCNGAMHILKVDFFQACKSYTRAPLLKYVMPRERSVDIDTAEDLAFAEFLHQRQALFTQPTKA